jgi:MarR family transcriptional regulator, lower aerobic nicotinate degradation pathway regulator
MKVLYHKRLEKRNNVVNMLGEDRPPEALAGYTGFLMNWVGARSRARFARALSERTGLHPREFGVLNMLARNPGITQHEIGEGAGVDPSTMVATLDSLEERGLAERRPNPEDRRKRSVYLTAAGEEALREGRKVGAAIGREVFAPLTAEERKQLHTLLQKLSGLDGD